MRRILVAGLAVALGGVPLLADESCPADEGDHCEAKPLAVGSGAPKFQLKDLEGKEVRLADLAGKPVVIETGSYSCPIFRGQVKAMRQLVERYGQQVTFLLVYTIEAHPKGSPSPYRPGQAEWLTPANQRDGILIRQPETYDQRVEVAKAMAEDLKPQIRVAIDDMKDAVWKAYGRRPNAGFVLDAELNLVAKQDWIRPRELARLLDQLVAKSE